MISTILVSLLIAGTAHAALVPTAPGPGQKFTEGGDCTLSWNLDTTGKWTSFNVDLMSGSNLAMQTVTSVFKARDGTKGETSYTWKCPKVTPNSAIYFYQFTQSGADTTWTTRFAIASASGEVTAPANAAQPGGAAIPWGVGHFAGAEASTANQTTVTPTAGSNTTALNTPAPASSVTANATGATNTGTSTSASSSSPAVVSAPTQSTSSSGTASTTSSKGPTTSPASSSTAGSSTPPPSSSDASFVGFSEVAMMALAFTSMLIMA